MSHVVHIAERVIAGRRLGRHVEHDPASKGFSTAYSTVPLVSAAWTRAVGPFDQGDLGKCTCEAMVGCLMTAPFFDPSRILGDDDATALYREATRLDRIPGHWPPDDTGSSGLAAAKAAHKRGWIKAYHHAFGLHSVLASLGRGPGMLGIDWYDGFDSPAGPRAELQISGTVRGGHEVEVTEVNVSGGFIRGPNSWGIGWGDAGYWTMSFDTLDRLLRSGGDFVVPVK